MEKAMISFCITYFNQEEFVEQSIKSILNIKMPCEFEILCGDDGSTDRTVEKIKELQLIYPNKIKYFVMKRGDNKKYNIIHRASANRLNLVEHSRGDYIMFLDGDDCYCNDSFIKDALEMFSKDDKLIGCAFNYQKKYLENNEIESVKQNLKTGFLITKEYIEQGKYIPSGAIVFKNIFSRQMLQILKDCKNFDDNLITIFMFQFGNVYYIDKPIYSYLQHKTSAWKSLTTLEQCLLNTMDYEIIIRVAPKIEKEIAKRQYPAIKEVYKNRKSLKESLGLDNYQKYLTENEILGNKFVCNLLEWNKLSIFNKFLVMFTVLKISFL